MSPWIDRRSGWRKRSTETRSDADIDYGRIVHSASFRRLQGKTQILNLGESDFYRTRLTHSLEVAQIATSITRQLRGAHAGHPGVAHLPEYALIQAIGSTHDLGHPPFGHGGEVALNYCMRDATGGFEGNGQTLRILSRLEKFSKDHGADVTRRTLLGTLKYPVAFRDVANRDIVPSLLPGTSTVQLIDRKRSKPPKCYMDSERDVVDWILEPVSEHDRRVFTSFKLVEGKHAEASHKSLDCSIMDVADDIAFGVHDLEDTLALSLMSRDEFEKGILEEVAGSYLDWLKERYPDESQNNVFASFANMLFGDGNDRKHAVSRMVSYFVESCFLDTVEELSEPLLRYRADIHPAPKAVLKALKQLVREQVVFSPEVQHLEFKGQQMVVAVFEALASDPQSFLPRDTLAVFEASGQDRRVVCDHVAGMTDSYLLRMYERLFSPRIGSVFDKL